jgi:hypothetical protein
MCIPEENVEQQCVVFDWKESDDYFLGTKEIKFRLVARDPRKMDEYSAAWKAPEALVYDESQVEEDLFKLKLGARPMPKATLQLIPESSEEELCFLKQRWHDIGRFQGLAPFATPERGVLRLWKGVRGE